MDKYKYELVHKDVGHTKVKELIIWLMMDAVEVCALAVVTPLPVCPFSGTCTAHECKLDNNKCNATRQLLCFTCC